MKLSNFFVILVSSLLLYQNCGSSQSMPADSPAGESVHKASVGEIDETKPINIQTQAGSTDLNLSTGEVQSGAQCLKTAILDELKMLLKNASVCETDNNVPKDAMCTMIYIYPYIELYLKGDSQMTRLGEATSGCPEVTTDFCEKAEDLKQLISDINPAEDFIDCQ